MELTLSNNIRDLRKKRGMTQEQLAEALGVTVGAVYKWESKRSMPEVSLLMQMADLFEVSVDALLGYCAQSRTVESISGRIKDLMRTRDFDLAAAEAEKALQKFPNDFRLVHQCGMLYLIKGVETDDAAAPEKAIVLLQRSISLLSQNTDESISLWSIESDIATCFLAQGKTEQAIALLKQYNVGGIHNALIGLNYASKLHQYQEALPYLVRAFANCLQSLIRTMIGYANVFDGQKNDRALLEALTWLIGLLDSVTEDPRSVTYFDKLKAPLLAQCAVIASARGDTDGAQAYLRQAYRCASRYDATPITNMQGIRFCFGDEKSADAYDDLGSSAMQAVQTTLFQEDTPENLLRIWEALNDDKSQ